MGMGNKKTIIGYEYNGTIHSGIGLAMDELYRIDIGDKCAWLGSVKSNGSIYINQYNLFGGKKGEGGVQGMLDIMFGGDDQGQNPYLVRYLGAAIPAFRHTVTTVFSGMIAAMNWYPKTWNFYYRRIKAGWPDNTPFYPETIEISLANGQIKAMNPAHILYESYISHTWGAGIPRAMMDDEAYKKVADTLYAEGFGLCFEWKATDELKKLREYVCNHIDAVIGTDPKTGKNTIRLIRDDYNIEDLPVFDEDTGLLEIKLQASNNTEVPSQILVKYNDAITFEERTAYASNPAIAQGQTGINTETNEYLGIPTGDLATRVAYRDLKAKTSGIKSATIKLDRRAYDIVNGQPFRIKTKYRANNIDLVVRATKRQERFLTDGAITMEVIQDVFSTPKVAFMPVPDAPARPEQQPPVPIADYRLLEATYRDLITMVDPANLELIDSSSGFIYAVAQSPADQCYSYDLVSRVKGAANFSEVDETGAWCPSAIIASDIGYTDTTIHIQDGQLLEASLVGTAALIDEEIVRIDAIDLVNNQLTIGRGCVDTVPNKHGRGVTIWFIDNSETTDGVEYSQGNNVEVKLLPNTFRERLEQSQAETKAITIQARQGRPYPPGNLKINGKAYPETITGSTINITWSSRHRIIQADKLIDTTASDTGEETGITYNIKIKNYNAVLHEAKGLKGLSYTWKSDLVSRTNLVLMHFENNLTDESGNTWINSGTPIYCDGVIGSNAIRFNATSFTHLLCNDEALLDFGTDVDFTIEFWCRPLAFNATFGSIIASNQSSHNTLSKLIMVYGNGSNVPQCVGMGGSGISSIISTSKLPISQWTHVSFTRYGSLCSVFINGIKEASKEITVPFNFSANGTLIGRNLWNGNNGLFEGDIDELRISRGCLYINNFTPPTEPYSNSDETRVEIELESERDGFGSYQKHSYSFKMGGD